MRLYAEQGVRGKVLDVDTGLLVRKVLWLDEELGELEALKVDALGNEVKELDSDGVLCSVTYRARGHFKFLKSVGSNRRDKRPIGKHQIAMGAPGCAICGTPLTIPGDDLCPPCSWENRYSTRASALGRPEGMRVARTINPLLGQQCLRCSRPATYSVGDEVATTPSIGKCGRFGIRAFTTAYTVGRRYYCAWHFEPPRILDAKGQVIEEIDHSHGVRP